MAALLSTLPASAADFYWSGGSSTSDLIDQGNNWYGNANPPSDANLYFNNTVGRHWAQSNYGAGSYFANIVTYSGAGGIKWLGDKTYAYKFENSNDSEVFEIASDIGNRSVADIELNPVGDGGILVNGTVSITDGKQINVYGNKTLTVNGVISGVGAGLSIQNAATMVLAANNTYTGSTTVNGGTLVINGNQTTATGAVSVSGKLAGNGTVGGATTINSGGKHAVGNGTNGSVGEQTFKENLTYSTSSIFEWDLTGESVSTGFDKVMGAADKTFAASGAFNVMTGLDFASSFWDSQQQWTSIFAGFGTLTGWSTTTAVDIFTVAGVSRNVSDQGSFSISGTTLTWTAVPEPSSALAGILLTAGLLRRKRDA